MLKISHRYRVPYSATLSSISSIVPLPPYPLRPPKSVGSILFCALIYFPVSLRHFFPSYFFLHPLHFCFHSSHSLYYNRLILLYSQCNSRSFFSLSPPPPVSLLCMFHFFFLSLLSPCLANTAIVPTPLPTALAPLTPPSLPRLLPLPLSPLLLAPRTLSALVSSVPSLPVVLPSSCKRSYLNSREF